MRPLPFSKPFGGPQTPSRFVRDLQRECPSLSAGQILKIIRDRLAECRDNLQALNEEVRVKQLEFSWARHLYEDGSLRFAPSAVIDGALLAAAEGEESNSSPARTKTEEIGGSEKHGSETSIEKGSVGMATANPDESSPLSSVTTSSSSSSWGKSDGELQSSPCVGYRTRHRPPFTKSESEKDGNCNIIRAGDETPKRPCPSPLTPKKREAAPSLGSMMDRYFPDSPNQQKSERSDSVQVKLSAEDRLSERDLARRKLLRQKVADELGRKQTALKASRERFLADDTRMKEDAWMAARERVRWCEWDIMTLEYDVGLLLLNFTRLFGLLAFHAHS